MAASMGTAIHNSVEDLCNLDISDRDDDETGWLHSVSYTHLTLPTILLV